MIGRNVARLRGQKTQQDVAGAMRSAGYKWSQATVWSVEKGERPLKLAEAEDLAKIMGTDLVALLVPPVEGMILEGLRAGIQGMLEARREFHRATAAFNSARELLSEAVHYASEVLQNEWEDERLHRETSEVLNTAQEALSWTIESIVTDSQALLAQTDSEASDGQHSEKG